MDISNLSKKSQWIVLAVASGACAAFNGVFAKLYALFSVLQIMISYSGASVRFGEIFDQVGSEC